MSAAAKRRRACCPPEKLLTIRFKKSLKSIFFGGKKFTASSTSWISRSILCASDREYVRKYSAIVFSLSSGLITCLAMAMCLPAVIKMRPSCGLSSPVIILKIVDLPAPFCPMSVILEPSRTEKFASSRSHFGFW